MSQIINNTRTQEKKLEEEGRIEEKKGKHAMSNNLATKMVQEILPNSIKLFEALNC